MIFRHLVNQDIDTFLNLDEFAELVELNGVKVKAVKLQSSTGSQTTYRNHNGISPAMHGVKLEGRAITLYVRTCDLEKKPRNGEFVKVEGIRYKVQNSADSQGVLKMELTADFSG